MPNEYYGVASTPTDDFIAHYGIKGMRWGVRKAKIMGNERAMDRHFRKAVKKLNKLQDRALNSGKYAAKSAGYATAAGGAAALALNNNKLAKLIRKRFLPHATSVSIANDLIEKAKDYKDKPATYEAIMKMAKAKKTAKNVVGSKIHSVGKFMDDNSKKVRIGEGLAALGLGAAAAKNAYIAANGKKYLYKADDFKKAMDESFAGTKYAGQYVVPPKQKKRRKKNG